MRVIGTAGHVDHGKSALVAALTGTHPDRLKEEKERQMTIDLGFGWFTLPKTGEVGIVDVPGHRDFIENMLAGVGGIDAAILVIAADEGVMPQTREHLAILDILQVRSGVIALTKIDLITDQGWLDLVEADIRSVLHGTVLQDAPIMRVSSRTGQGLPGLIQSLDNLLQDQPARPDLGRPRLPVDRVFTMPGFGTVVTGTLSDGALSIGDSIVLLPSGLSGRIRGLQAHSQKEETAHPGSRTAINISGLDVSQVRRGEVVTHPGQYFPTQRVDVLFRLLPDISSPLRHNTEVKVYVGTSETVADIRLLGTEALAPGEQGWLQLSLHSPVVALRGDRYILRRPSPGETLGGGIVVDPQPKRRHKRFDASVIAALESMSHSSPVEVLLQSALALGPAPASEVLNRSRLTQPASQVALQELLSSGQLLALEDILVTASHWSTLKKSLVESVAAYHHDYPLRRGMPREELKSRLKVQPRFFNLSLSRLAVDGEIQEFQKWIALPRHTVRFSPFQQVKVDQLLATFSSNPTTPPSVKECQAQVGDDVYAALVEAGLLVPVSSEVVYRKADYDVLVDKIHQAIISRSRITLAEVRDLLSASRKYVQALLEHLDAIGVTVREGDFRRLRK
jgi:selenocysteine-specific elongation factor